MTNFDYENIPIGYYDKVLIEGMHKNKGIQANWHNKKFTKFMKEYQPADSFRLWLWSRNIYWKLFRD